jgi:predicted anti-sigma-YlaC factor YlaD
MEDHRNLACENYEALLEDYLSGELDTAEAARVESHIVSCSGCRSATNEAASGSRLMKFVGYSPDWTPGPGPNFARLVMARIRTEQARAEEGTGFWQPLVSMAWKFAATAAFALVLLLTFSGAGNNLQETEVAAVSPADTQDLFAPDPTAPPANLDEALMMVAGTDYGKQ